MGSHPVRLFANKKCDGSYAGRNHAPLARGRIFERGWMRREASPAHGARQAELIQPLRIVVRDASCENLPLPRVGGDFKPLKLPQYFKRSPFTLDLRSRRDVLPSQQPAHELGSRYGFDLLSQGCDGEPMDSRQQTSLTPFEFVWRGRRPRPLISKLSTQD